MQLFCLIARPKTLLGQKAIVDFNFRFELSWSIRDNNMYSKKVKKSEMTTTK